MPGLGDRLRGWLGRPRDGSNPARAAAPVIRVHVLIRGRIGAGWYDVDRELALPAGTTLGQLIDSGEQRGVPLAEALANSPHLAHTLMLNGARCPVAEHRDRALQDGDQLYLLAPIAGG
jgi:molybdopterin converting factor small subunit